LHGEVEDIRSQLEQATGDERCGGGSSPLSGRRRQCDLSWRSEEVRLSHEKRSKGTGELWRSSRWRESRNGRSKQWLASGKIRRVEDWFCGKEKKEKGISPPG
jgi:hypothetical protein